MRIPGIIAMLSALALLLSGCGVSGEVENQAYVLVLGVDRVEDGRLRLTARVPQIGKSKAAGQDGEDGGYLTFSGSGENYPQALESLEQATPRKMNLSHIELLVVSEALAREERFGELIAQIAETPHLYTTARFVVCEGDARAFIEAQDAVIGARLSSEINAMLNQYAEQGYIPFASFADAWYLTGSVYGDAVAVRGFTQTARDAPAVSLVDTPTPVAGTATSPMGQRYAGAALFREGRMVGTLDSNQTRLLNLIRGEIDEFPFECDGRRYALTPEGKARHRVDIDTNSMALSLDVHFSTLDDVCALDAALLEAEMERALFDVIQVCQRVGSEPFGFAEDAAASYLTLKKWRAFDWRALYESATVNVSVQIDGAYDA